MHSTCRAEYTTIVRIEDIKITALCVWLSYGVTRALVKGLGSLLNREWVGYAYAIHVEWVCSVEKTELTLRARSARYRSKISG